MAAPIKSRVPAVGAHVARSIQLRPAVPVERKLPAHLAAAIQRQVPPALSPVGRQTAAPASHVTKAIQRREATLPQERQPAPHLARAMARPVATLQRKPSDLKEEFGSLPLFNLSPLKKLKWSAWQTYVVNVKPYFDVDDSDEDRQGGVLPTTYSRALSLSSYFAAELTSEQRTLAQKVNAKLAAEVDSLGAGIRATGAVYITADGGFAEVEGGDSEFAITNGFVKEGSGVRSFTAKLTFKKVKVSQAAVLHAGNAGTQVDALEISDLTALWSGADNQQARGTKAGSLLAYHLALYAVRSGIAYIVATNITAARQGFYEPHGFQDYLTAPTYATLKGQADAHQIKLNEYGRLSREEFEKIKDDFTNRSQLQLGLKEQMAANRIFVTTALLRQRALTALQGKWQRKL